MKSVLWVSHRIRRIRNRTSDEEVIEKKRLKFKDEKKERRENENDDDDEVKRKEENACLYMSEYSIQSKIILYVRV